MEPGQTITPQTPPEPTSPNGGVPEPERPTDQPVSTPAPAPVPEPSAATLPMSPIASEAPADWQFHQETDPGMPNQTQNEDMSWTASEFIEHPKNFGWYAILAACGIVAAAVIYLLTKDKITTGTVVLALIVFGAFASRKPRAQQYGLSHDGLQIGMKSYGFQEFKTFSVTDEGATASIVFMPLKRFMPPLTIYVPPDMEDKVVDFLSDVLPFEQHKPDVVENLLRRIHF